MTADLFPKVLKHIVSYTKCSTENRILLLVDNHESHISVRRIQFCRESGISLLSFPPHTTHRMQPLDVGVYGPFKNALSVAFNDWMISHPGRLITIRNIGQLSDIAYKSAFTIKNITSSFKTPGIWPINRLAFNADDFIPSTVTDIPLEQRYNDLVQKPVQEENPQIDKNNNELEIIPNAVNNELDKDLAIPSTSFHQSNNSFEELRPLPKISGERKKVKRKYESKSRVYTCTLEYIEKKMNRRRTKKEEKCQQKK
ncbi:hypothetical protein ABEB36_009753 [Hypothenemus hampei]|uniref:DDE-1 domain-containing protein n=1 Tax=Hypothenemus hampei TaxID=57062 RepID=A0ABD1ELF8_HYPHA